MHYNILVCGVLICKASIIDSVILISWIKCKLSLYRHDIKTSQILSLNTVKTVRILDRNVCVFEIPYPGSMLSKAGKVQQLNRTKLKSVSGI